MIFNNEVTMKTEIIDMPGVNNLFKTGGLFLAGQPDLTVLEKLKEMGITKVYNLRSVQEMDFSAQEAKLKELGIDYVFLPIMENGALSAEACKKLNEMIDESETNFIHCGSANRVAGWLITYLIAKKGIELEEAVNIAQNSGLRSVEFVEQAQDILGV